MTNRKDNANDTFLGGAFKNAGPPKNLPTSSVPARPPATDFGSGAPKRERKEGTPTPSHDENMAHVAEKLAEHKAGLNQKR